MTTLSQAGRKHLDNLFDIESKRRPIDSALASPIIAMRDVLLCAATNLESGVPQSQPHVAEKLRNVADEVVEMDLKLQKHITQQIAGRMVRAPQLRRWSEIVRGMPHDDAPHIARMLAHLADELAAAPPRAVEAVTPRPAPQEEQ